MSATAPIPPPSTVQTETFTLGAQGRLIPAFLASKEGAPWKSATVVLGGSLGIDGHVQEVCRALAEAGHGALALDLEPRTSGVSLTAGADTGPRDVPTGQLDRHVAAVAAALALLRGHAAAPPRFGVVGYGTGGYVALVSGYRCQFGAAVSVDGEGPRLLRASLSRIVDGPKPHAASLLCLLGGNDDAICPADLGSLHADLDSVRVRHTFIVYPRTRNGFCRPEAPTFRATEAEDAWTKVLHALESAPRPRHRFGHVAARKAAAA